MKNKTTLIFWWMFSLIIIFGWMQALYHRQQRKNFVATQDINNCYASPSYWYNSSKDKNWNTTFFFETYNNKKNILGKTWEMKKIIDRSWKEDENYANYNDRIYWYGKEVISADANTFQHVGWRYRRDKDNIYVFWSKIDANTTDFQILDNESYWKDSRKVFFSQLMGCEWSDFYSKYWVTWTINKTFDDFFCWLTTELELNPPKTVVYTIHGLWNATDQEKLYIEWVFITWAGINNIKQLWYWYLENGHDIQFLNQKLLWVDKNTFQAKSFYAKDSQQVYCKGQVISKDISHFQDLWPFYAKDSQNVFSNCKIISWADVSSFEMAWEENDFWNAIDKNHVYHNWNIISWVKANDIERIFDPKYPEVDYRCFKDKSWKYFVDWIPIYQAENIYDN